MILQRGSDVLFNMVLIYLAILNINGYSLNISDLTFKPWKETIAVCNILMLNYTSDFHLDNENFNITMEVREVIRRRERMRGEVTCMDSGKSGYCEFPSLFSPHHEYIFSVHLKNGTYSQELSSRKTKLFLEDIRGPLEVTSKHFDKSDVNLEWERPWVESCDLLYGFTGIEISCESDQMNKSCFKNEQHQSLFVKYEDSSCIGVLGNTDYANCDYFLKDLAPSKYYKIKVRYTTSDDFYIEDTREDMLRMNHWSKYSNIVSLPLQQQHEPPNGTPSKGKPVEPPNGTPSKGKPVDVEDSFSKLIIIIGPVGLAVLLVVAIVVATLIHSSKQQTMCSESTVDFDLVGPRDVADSESSYETIAIKS